MHVEPKTLSKNDVPRVRNPRIPIVLDELNCQGSEAKLSDCGRSAVVEQCSHYSSSGFSDAGAFCANIKGWCKSTIIYYHLELTLLFFFFFFFWSPVECNDSDVRLMPIQADRDMEHEGRGRVEFCSSGRWILVCYDHWDNDDATVLCRQLGYDTDGKLKISYPSRTITVQ